MLGQAPHSTMPAALTPNRIAGLVAPASDAATPAPRHKTKTERNMFGEHITTVLPPAAPTLEPRDLPWILSGLRIRQATPFGNMHVKITVDPRTEREMEVFAQLGKGGDLATSDLEAICRIVSLWLRAGGSLHHVVKQLSDIGSSLQIATRTGRIMSLGDGLAQALKRYVKAKERHGLKSLLLGETDPSELDSEYVASRATAHANGGNGHNGGDAFHPAGDSPLPSPAVMRVGMEAERAPDLAPMATAVATRPDFKLKCPDPDCTGTLYKSEGCVKCVSCGYAQC